ncbi:aminoglycoside O-phosphotransferase APH(3')-IIb [Actinomadura kijaniata]|uniref:Kanamycin kinase/aminoglycoside 3'-phosphotransferase-2 n=1 Tax=Actinomadura namibiensis TaxID=182080 RepID=A0A7W3LQA2_ACTNM|nr:aminoglycoside 3'-phosphotransferase [Actinomadura namibiensis]MBA8952325.1 kanamycin kinase/aminoglycoside 3'-phosphotransferase-2 [Actinomadura namibiensis]
MDLSELLGPGAVWSSDHEGASGTVRRVTAGGGTFYVKQGPPAAAEHPRLRWLGKYLPVPEVVAFTGGALVLADVGAPSLEGAAPADIGAVMGRALRALHTLPVPDCPFDGRLATVLERAAANVRDGAVDPDDFDDDHRDLTPGQVLDRLFTTRPPTEDLVVAHGDYTPSNVLLPASGDPVLIDVSALGVADRYRDLAIARRDLVEDHGEAAWEAFWESYGLVPEPDADRLDYYRLLDELF